MDLLAQLTAVGALREGHFLLASGRHGDRYVEKFDLLRRPRMTSEACAMIAARFAPQAIDVVVGPTTGGILLAFETARLLGVEAAYAERASNGDSQREIRRGTVFPAGARVLIVDDILTTGGSIRETLEALKTHPVEVVAIAVLVDRSGGRVRFGLELTTLAELDLRTWEPEACPLCASGQPITQPGTTQPPAGQESQAG